MTSTPGRPSGLTGYVRPRGSKLEIVIRSGGKTITKATGLDVGQEEEAQRFLEGVLQDLGAGTQAAPAPGALTFQEWGERWVAERKKRGVISASDEEAHLAYHAFPTFGARPLRSLTKAELLEWARALESRVNVKTGKPLSSRYVGHVAGTVKRLMEEAVRIDLVVANPCVWRKSDLPKKRDTREGIRRMGGFEPWEVWELLHHERVAPDRRVLYGIEFFTGLRTGEVAIRRWQDWDEAREPLGCLAVDTAWNSRAHLEKSTKTDVRKTIPVHPELARILAAWKAEGWKAYVGREPKPEDLVVPAERGGVRNVSHSNALFQDDCAAVGLREGRTHYATRATFFSLAQAGGASEADVKLITHPSPSEAAGLYRRDNLLWPKKCQTVLCVRIAPRDPVSSVAVACVEEKKARPHEEIGPSEKRAVQDSNLWPSAPEADALSS